MKLCPFAQKAWIGLELCNTPYELQEIPLYGPIGKPAWFRELNRKGTVPTLVSRSTPNEDGGSTVKVWTDSDEILDHLFSDHGYHRNDEDKKLMREWRYDLINQQLLPIAQRAVLEFGHCTNELSLILAEIDNHRVITDEINNNDLSIGHCHAFPFLWRLDQSGFSDASKYANIHKWLRCCERHPAFAKTIQRNWWWWW